MSGPSIGALTKGGMAKEASWGALTIPTIPLSIISNSMVNKIGVTQDMRLIGQLLPTGFVKTSEDPGGGINFSVHPNEVGYLLYGAMGAEDAPSTASKCYLVVSYYGSAVYADIVMASGVLTGSAGATVGTKVSAFALDTSVTANNTPTKLAALINAITGWGAYVFGDGASASHDISDFSLYVIQNVGTIENMNSKIMSVPSSSTASKVHHLYPGGSSTTWPSWTIMKDQNIGNGQAVAYIGCMPEVITLKMSAAKEIELSSTFAAKQEVIGQTFPTSTIYQNPTTTDNLTYTLTLPLSASYVNQSLKVLIDGVDQGTACTNAATEAISTSPNVGSGTYIRATGVFSFTFSGTQAAHVITISYGCSVGIAPAYDSMYVSGLARLIINGTENILIKDISLAVNLTLAKDHVTGSLFIIQPVPTAASIKVSGNAVLSAADYLLKYADYCNVAPEEMIIYIENASFADKTNDTKYNILMKINSFVWNKYESPIPGPARLSIAFEAETVYNPNSNHIDVWVQDTNTSSY